MTVLTNVIDKFEMESEDFSHQLKLPNMAISTAEIEIMSIPEAGEYLCHLQMLPTFIHSL